MLFPTLVTLVTVLFAAIAENLPPQHGHRVVCYMGSWGDRVDDKLTFNAFDAEPALRFCTHIIYPRLVLEGEHLDVKFYQDNGQYALNNVKHLVLAKSDRFPYLKIIISVGLHDGDKTPYSSMAETQIRRTIFVRNVLEFVLEHSLDGMDVGWTFAASTPRFTEKNVNQVLLLKQLREEFDKYGLSLSVTIWRVTEGQDVGVDTTGLAKHVHFVNVGSHVQRTFSNPVERYLVYGVPPEKINIVVFSVVTGFNVQNPVEDKTGLVNKRGPNFILYYHELCREMERGEWTEDFDNQAGSAYFVKEDFLVTSDNPKSIFMKISFAMNKTLGGITFLNLDSDDYKGECVSSGGKFPMLRKIDRTLVELSSLAYQDIFDSLELYDASYFWRYKR